MPSVRISDINYESNKNSTLISGDTLKVSFTATNYLAQVTNTVIRLTTDSEYISSINNIVSSGELSTFESYNNYNSPFFFKIDKEIPSDHTVRFTYELKGEGYDDYQIFDQIINKSFIDVSNNTMTTTLPSNGKIGFASRVEDIGTGLIYKTSGNKLERSNKFCPKCGIGAFMAKHNSYPYLKMPQRRDKRSFVPSIRS